MAKRKHLNSSLFKRFGENIQKMECVAGNSYKVRNLGPNLVRGRHPQHEYVRVDFGLFRNDADCVTLTTRRYGHAIQEETVQIALIGALDGTQLLLVMMEGQVWTNSDWGYVAQRIRPYSGLCSLILRAADDDVQARYQLQVKQAN